MSIRKTARYAGLAVLLVGLCTSDSLAAKPTDAFKRGVESAWRKVPYSRMTGKSGTVQTWGVVLADGLVAGAPVVRKAAMWVGDTCYTMERADGSFRVPEEEKQKVKKLLQPVPPGTVLELSDVSFKNEGVVFNLSDPGHPVTRELIGGKGATVNDWESFCVLLQFSLAPSAEDRLDAADAPKMLSAIEGVIKPFSSRAAAAEFAKTVKRP